VHAREAIGICSRAISSSFPGERVITVSGTNRSHLAIIAIVALVAQSCGPSADSAPRVPLSANAPMNATTAAPGTAPGSTPLPPRARIALDSGNAQLRAKRYDDALASYRVAVKEAPGHVAPEFGVYMVAKRQGNNVLADSALRIINAHTGGSPAWTDSAMRSAHGDRKLPASHPSR
jgi:hypothetical protein